MAYAKSWGFGGIVVVNLFAFRATNPKELRFQLDAIGPDNDHYVKGAVGGSIGAVAAWGSEVEKWPGGLKRAKEVLAMGKNWACLDVTNGGQPKHPLYLRGDLRMQDFERCDP